MICCVYKKPGHRARTRVTPPAGYRARWRRQAARAHTRCTRTPKTHTKPRGIPLWPLDPPRHLSTLPARSGLRCFPVVGTPVCKAARSGHGSVCAWASRPKYPNSPPPGASLHHAAIEKRKQQNTKQRPRRDTPSCATPSPARPTIGANYDRNGVLVD